jgi:hypothetical protein
VGCFAHSGRPNEESVDPGDLAADRMGNCRLGWLEGAERDTVWQRYIGVVQWKDDSQVDPTCGRRITGLGGPVAVFSTTGPQLSELPAAHRALRPLYPAGAQTPRGGPCTRRSQKQQIVGRCAQITRLRAVAGENMTGVAGQRHSR